MESSLNHHESDSSDHLMSVRSKKTPATCTTTGSNNREARRQQLLRNEHLKRETVRLIDSLLEGKSDADSLRKCVSLLSKNDYNDLNTERSLAHICGYPLCDNKLSPGVTNSRQLFKIDLKERKVFRMEERALFCSVTCLESSNFLRKQLSDQALWIRFNDKDGYEGLYRQGAGIKFKHEVPDGAVGAEDEVSPVGSSVKKSLSTRDTVSLPYIKQEQLLDLQKSMDSLKIKEREDPFPVSSIEEEEEEDQYYDAYDDDPE